MKFSLACITALAGFAAAQNDVQSKPFKLVLTSDDKSLNGKTLSACHTGAAIESLCLTEGGGSKFKFNTTKGATAEVKGLTAQGKLTFDLPLGGDPSSVSEPMYFGVDPASNVALPLFTPSDSDIQYVSFDKKSEALRVITYTDDTKKPVQAGKARALNRWYVCSTNYLGYNYKTLTWVLGVDKPQNPSCKKVDVKRKF
ncbi:hypothetical protein LIA77_00671 [Sarocladium implicatum]|nr:hypothetical protein LIA77_00671 [Sarocladium implicatum]